MRLIDADELIKTLESFMDLPDPGYAMGIGRAIWLVKDAPTIPAPQWISVEDRLPEEQKEVLIYLPEYDSVEMASLFTIPSMNLREWVQNEDAYMLDEVSYWMPMPEPPEKRYKCRYADGDGVCSKCSGNGEIIYCVEGPCPYDMPEEVRDDGAHIEP